MILLLAVAVIGFGSTVRTSLARAQRRGDVRRRSAATRASTRCPWTTPWSNRVRHCPAYAPRWPRRSIDVGAAADRGRPRRRRHRHRHRPGRVPADDGRHRPAAAGLARDERADRPGVLLPGRRGRGGQVPAASPSPRTTGSGSRCATPAPLRPSRPSRPTARSSWCRPTRWPAPPAAGTSARSRSTARRAHQRRRAAPRRRPARLGRAGGSTVTHVRGDARPPSPRASSAAWSAAASAPAERSSRPMAPSRSWSSCSPGRSARGRTVSYLRTLGLSRRQSRLLAFTEITPTLFAAAVAGWVLGLVLPAPARARHRPAPVHRRAPRHALRARPGRRPRRWRAGCWSSPGWRCSSTPRPPRAAGWAASLRIGDT